VISPLWDLRGEEISGEAAAHRAYRDNRSELRPGDLPPAGESCRRTPLKRGCCHQDSWMKEARWVISNLWDLRREEISREAAAHSCTATTALRCAPATSLPPANLVDVPR
jgi:hypothetical protein